MMEPREIECLAEVKRQINESDDQRVKKVVNDNDFLLRFVRGRKFNSKYAYETLVSNFRTRFHTYNKFYSSLSPSSIRHVFDSKMLGALKHRDKCGRKIVYFRIKNWDLEKCSADDIMKACIVCAEELANSKETQLNGIVLICDYQDFSWGHAKHYSLSQMRMFINIFLYSYPTRFGQGHMLNVPKSWEMAYSIFKPFLPTKVKERVHLSRNSLKSLHESLSPDILPEWLGGNLPETEANDLSLEKSVLDKEHFYANFNSI